jgi:signal recognition particle receptor subunit beta
MTNKTMVETFTSIKENIGVLNVPKNCKIIDLPGHERIRYKCLDQQKDSAMGIIYLLDASTIAKQIRDTTEFLFQILSDPTINSNRTPVLVICNKQDMTMNKSASVIERELAKEIGLLRETHAGTLQGTDGSITNHIFLGKPDKDFSFADLKVPVDFCETSVLNENNLDKVQAWISSISC